MDKILKKLPIAATVALLVAGAFLFAGCEKEKNGSKIIGTWIACGASLNGDPICSYIIDDPDDPESEIDTISFLSNHKIKDNYKWGYTGYKYDLIGDTTLIVQDGSRHHEYRIKFSNDNMIIYNWRNRDITCVVYNVCFRKINKKRW